MAGNRLQWALAGHVRNRRQQAQGVRVRGPREQAFALRHLDDAPGVHHHHAVDQVLDHGQVVGHVHRRHPLLLAQPAQGLQDVRLGADVEGGGGFVEHDQARAQHEGQGQHHPLLLAAGQLMGEAPEKLAIAGQADVHQGLLQAVGLGRAGKLRLVGQQGFAQQVADAQRRVEGHGRVLRNIADQPAAGAAQGIALELEQRGAGNVDAPAGNLRSAPGMGQQRGGQGGLARAGLADKAEDFTGGQAEVDVVDDIGAAGEFDPQVLDPQRFAGNAGSYRRCKTCRRRRCRRRGHQGMRIHLRSPALCRAMPSARILVP